MAVPSLLDPAKREVRLGSYGRRVDVRDPVVQIRHHAERTLEVLCIEAARKAVAHVVVDRNRLIQARHPDHTQHRTKDLFLLEP